MEVALAPEGLLCSPVDELSIKKKRNMSANRLQFWSPGWSFSTAFQLFAKFGNFLFLDSDSKEQYIKKKNMQNNI